MIYLPNVIAVLNILNESQYGSVQKFRTFYSSCKCCCPWIIKVTHDIFILMRIFQNSLNIKIASDEFDCTYRKNIYTFLW